MSTEPYRWHYDYTRILWDAGFNFDNQKSLKTFDRNCIALLDIERIIRERDIRIVEHHIQNILEYTLDAEDARILDSTFVKIFRLSQLAVEYLNSCKKYLDSTTDTLKKELQKASEENDELKHDIVQYELELSKLKKKIKDIKSTLYIYQKYQPPGTARTSFGRFRCNLCKKGFLNADYLKKHLFKRHPDSTELQHFDTKLENTEDDSENNSVVNPQYKAETEKLQMEIKELKEKLNNTERYFQNTGDHVFIPDQDEAKELKTHTEDYSVHVSKLHNQFEVLKNQIESEMHILKSQKFEQDKYEELFEKLFQKLTEKREKDTDTTELKDTSQSNEPSTSKIVETILSAKSMTETTQMNETSGKESQPSISTQETNGTSAPDIKSEAKTKTTTETISKTQSLHSFDVESLKKQMEKELDERAKQNIDRLGKQISENIANTFDVFQTRLETFWTKLQEIEVDRLKQQQKTITSPIKQKIIAVSPKKIQSPSKIPQKVQRINLTTSPQKFIPKPAQRIKISPVKTTNEITREIMKVKEEIKKQENITTTDSDSETESSRQEKLKEIPSVLKSVQKNDELARNLIAELKTKVQEQNSKQEKSPEKPTKMLVQMPKVTQIFSQDAKNESSSEESETDSESETETETESAVITKPSKTTVSSKRPTTNTTDGARSTATGISTLKNRSISSLENALRLNPDILVQLRGDMVDVVASRLKDLGIDPEWSTIPEKTYKQKLEIITHHRNMAAKNVQSFLEIRNSILENLEGHIKEIKDKENKDPISLEPEQKQSRFKNLIQNVKSKAISIMKSDRPATPIAPIYKLSVHRHHSAPAIKQSQNVKEHKSRSKHTIVKNQEEKHLDKDTMYDTDSEIDSLPREYKRLTPIKSEATKSETNRKSIQRRKSDSSLDVVDLSDHNTTENQKPPSKNLAQSLDSILEMKKELALQLQKELTAQINQAENKLSSSLGTIDNPDEVIAVSPKESSIDENITQNINTVKVQDIASSDTESDEFKEEKVQKGVLKNVVSTNVVKKKVLFDLHSDAKTSETNDEQIEIKQEKTPIKKTIVKANPLFKTNDWNSSSSLDSSVDIRRVPKQTIIKGQSDTISTKAVINVTTKQSKAHDDTSDWEISDIN